MEHKTHVQSLNLNVGGIVLVFEFLENSFLSRKMVYFVCNRCQETIRKCKVEEHSHRCGSSSFSCVDCGKDFSLAAAQNHNTCITEEEKYQGKLYNGANVY